MRELSTGWAVEPRRGALLNEVMQNICDYDKEVGRERITLPEPTFAINPAARHSVEHDDSFSGRENTVDPAPPKTVEAPGGFFFEHKPRVVNILSKLYHATLF
jgi:hypothetical protein